MRDYSYNLGLGYFAHHITIYLFCSILLLEFCNKNDYF